LAVCV
jgi:hypothetical protein